MSGEEKVFFGDGIGQHYYFLALASHSDLFRRGCEEIFHHQLEAYYRALIQVPDEKLLGLIGPSYWLRTCKTHAHIHSTAQHSEAQHSTHTHTLIHTNSH